MTIKEIYQHYPVHRGLQEHMIRVAAVAKLICDNSTQPVDTENIVTACLLHDMGNLLKVKFDLFPELFMPEGVEYWQGQQALLVQRYGNNVHRATMAIVSELQLPAKTLKTLEAIGDEPTKGVSQSDNLEHKIATYSDMRVGLNNVVSLVERMSDLKDRYVGRDGGFLNMNTKAEDIDNRHQYLKKIELDIFSRASLQPEQITDESTVAIQTELWDWVVT